MKSFWKLLVFGFTIVRASFPENKREYPDGFWFGTQSQMCVNGKTGSEPNLTRSINIDDNDTVTVPLSSSSGSGSIPTRHSLRYLHRLVFYKDIIFEWGEGVRGYNSGPKASVTDCPVTWEQAPAGRSVCPVHILASFTRNYRSKFGRYHQLNNNCDHFANRLSAILSDPSCAGETSPGDSMKSEEDKKKTSSKSYGRRRPCLTRRRKQPDIADKYLAMAAQSVRNMLAAQMARIRLSNVSATYPIG